MSTPNPPTSPICATTLVEEPHPAPERLVSSLAPRIPLGLRYMAEGVLGFSAMSVLVKLVGSHIPANEIVIARTGITFVLSSIVLWREGLDPRRPADETPRGRHLWFLSLRGLAGFLALQCFVYSLVHLPLGEATLIQYTSPVFTAVFAALWLGEGGGRAAWVGTALSLLGVVAVAQPAFLFDDAAAPIAPFALWVSIAGAICAGLAYVTIRRLRGSADPRVVVWSVPAVGLPLALPTLFWHRVMPTPIEWLMLIGIGVLTQFAQLRMTQALHLEPAGRASAVTYLQVLLSVGWGIWLFGEQPSIFTLMGAVLVLGGTLIATGALPLPARWVTFWEAPVAIDPPASGRDPHADADHDR